MRVEGCVGVGGSAWEWRATWEWGAQHESGGLCESGGLSMGVGGSVWEWGAQHSYQALEREFPHRSITTFVTLVTLLNFSAP